MQTLVPIAPLTTAAELDRRPAATWVAPALLQEREYVRVRSALPGGMPDYLEVRILQLEEGLERTTSAIYGRHAYLIHYCLERAPGGTG